jgi:hypothetical protein
MDGIIQGVTVLLWIIVIFWALYRSLKFKAVIQYPDGTFKEKVISPRASRFEDGKDLYLVDPSCVFRRLIFGILPQARIFYLKGCPKPVGFHSGKPVSHVNDLKLLVGSDELRIFHRETRTAKLGMPERKVELKWFVYLAVVIGIGVIIYVIMSALTKQPAPITPTPTG